MLLRPALVERGDGALAKTLTARFAAVEKGLAPYRRSTPLGWALYGELTAKDRKTLAQAVDALAEPLSTVAAKVIDLTVSRRRLLEVIGRRRARPPARRGRRLRDRARASRRQTRGDRQSCRSTARTRPASRPRRRIGSRSPSFDLTLTTAAELRDLLRTWSEAAALLARGELLGPERRSLPQQPPADTGEAEGLPRVRPDDHARARADGVREGRRRPARAALRAVRAR